jgi:hypothetical protein
MTLTQFKKNELVIDAVVRNLEIIGEASKSVPIGVRRKYPVERGSMNCLFFQPWFFSFGRIIFLARF